MKTLIVYYSLEGNTEFAAEKIADVIGADTLKLQPKKAYKDKGLSKFLWGGRSALMAEQPELLPYEADLSGYDRILFGFPVWASNFTPPLRTFVAEHQEELRGKHLAAFACQAGNGAEKALEKLAQAIGIDGFEETAVFIDPKKKSSGETYAAIAEFCGKLK